jgi:nucleotide-binding universal stress UspA family protein
VLLTCRNVLLAADASEASARAIRAAESWVLNDGANATIMVSHEPTYEQMLAHAKAKGDSSVTSATGWRAEARAMLETSLKRVSIDDSRYALLIEEAPRPAVAIRRVAEQLRPGLLVVGRRGQCPRAINPGHCERGV